MVSARVLERKPRLGGTKMHTTPFDASQLRPRPSSSEPSAWRQSLTVRLRRAFGILLTINFAVFWALPIFIQGRAYKLGLRRVLAPVYERIDGSRAVRRFAARWIYQRPVHVDYFTRALLLVVSTVTALGVVTWWQVTRGSLPFWLIFLYYLAWVGFGGRTLGAAYTFAHREGHRPGGGLYRPWIRTVFGNPVENWLGFFYGNVPYNFSTSHVLLHHRLNGGKGDPFYMWDIDRSSWSDAMLFFHRTFIYMTGWSSLRAFKTQEPGARMDRAYRQLLKGFLLYWVVAPIAIMGGLTAAGSTLPSALTFLFFIYMQPLFAMSTFIALLNVPFHGFLEFEEDGAHIPCISSTTLIDGEDDSFGEDDHMAHHYFMAVEHRDLPRHQRTQHEEWARRHASVFKEISIIELSVFMLLKRWETIADKHYVDYSGKLTTEEIARMLEARAKRVEMSYEDYEFGYLPRIQEITEELVKRGTCANLSQAYRYQARHDLQPRLEPDAGITTIEASPHTEHHAT